MTVLLDTQVLVVLGTDDRLEAFPSRVRKLLLDPETQLVVSAISITEIAIKSCVGRISATAEQVSSMAFDLKLNILPYTAQHARRMFDLPLHHREPFDRMLIATAIVESIPLVGGDQHFPAYKPQGLSVIWK